jgi:hypothetical protein
LNGLKFISYSKLNKKEILAPPTPSGFEALKLALGRGRMRMPFTLQRDDFIEILFTSLSRQIDKKLLRV